MTSSTTSTGSDLSAAVPDPPSTLSHAPQSHPTLHNWSSTYNCSPELLFFPTTNEEVALILKEAVKRGMKVRAVGLHQSPGPAWHSDQWLISTRHFTQSSFSPSTRTATLGAGLVLRDVNPILASHGLALPTMGSLADVTIGALFSGPDHGSSAFHPVCAANAKSATIVLPSGEVRRIEKGEELFNAAAAGVGAVGIVTEVEWACEEAFGLEVTMEPCRLEDYLEDSDSGAKLWELARSSEYVKLWYYPSPTWSATSPNTVLWRARRVPLPPPQRETSLSVLSARCMHTLHGLAYLLTTYLLPALQPWLNAFLYWGLGGSLPKKEIMRSYEAQYMDCGYNQLVNEWSAPLPAPGVLASTHDSKLETDKRTSPPAPAAQVLRSLIGLFASPEGRAIGMHAPVELRFSAVKGGEELMLSPGGKYGDLLGRDDDAEDLIMWFEPIVYRPLNLPTPARFYRFFQLFESYLRSHPGCRPHWTKGHFASSEADLERMFGRERLERWRRIRDEVDPQKIMWNQWLEERVGSTEGRAGVAREETRSGRWEDVMGRSGFQMPAFLR
ncbi:hypothetical protein JCM10908_003610 [Rhodotorula pacifica]|uniref:uncharacterized protein n=1 Tax=Rhodotorula pacifica TaxID=1495444 RepID=UPI0031707E09